VIYTQAPLPYANQTLSNLTTPTAVNLTLIPGTASLDLGTGTTGQQWRNLYLNTAAYFNQQTTLPILYYNTNWFLHTVGGNNQGLFLGENAGRNVNSANEVNNGCVGIGYQALNTLGTGFTSISSNAGVGNHNTAIGWRALLNLNGDEESGSADKNTMIGSRAGELLTTGRENTGIGWNVFYSTMAENTITGVGNIGIGSAANPSGATFYGVLGSLSTGNYNTVVGSGSGTKILSGSNNIILGNNSGSNADPETAITTGSSNILIGSGVDVPIDGGATNNNMNIGNTLYGNLATDAISIGSPTLPSMFNIGSANQFQVSAAGVIAQYNNIATVSNGIPALYDTYDATGLTTSQSVNVYTIPANGLYRISYTLTATTPSATYVINIQTGYTDNDSGTAMTMPANNVNGVNQIQSNPAATAAVGGCFVINARAATNVNIITNAAGTVTYAVHVTIEKL
jgi:hypothetical protein